MYRRVDPRFWNDAKVRRLTDDGRYAFLFLLTHPNMTALGAMRATSAGLAAELGWPARRFAAALTESVRQGMVTVNEAAAFVALPNFLRYNEPNGPNAVKAWRRALELIPECPERQTLLASCQAYLDGKSDAFRHAIGDAIEDAIRDGALMPSGIQEQEQGQEQGQEQVSSPHPPHGGADAGPTKSPHPRKARRPDLRDADATLALALLNELAGTAFKPTPANLKHARARLADGYTLADLQAVVRGQVKAWQGSEWAQYLRPQTLFGEKFAGYLEATRHARNGAGDARRITERWSGAASGEVKL
jgi:uncharacterized phage protein (TIGR02220 family)